MDIPEELKEKAKKLEEEESEKSTKKIAIYHDETTVGNDGKLDVVMHVLVYVDETETHLIDTNGKEWEKRRVASYKFPAEENPLYDLKAICKEDLGG